MIEYLKRAFWIGPRVPGLGRLPVNALATLGFGILGFGHPAFWLLGVGLEAAYLGLVAGHPRLQRLVDAERPRAGSETVEQGWRELTDKLPQEARRRLALVELKRDRILQLAREAQAGDFEAESRRDALDRLTWIYLKLLVARHHLEASREETREEDLKRQIAGLEGETAAGDAPPALRESQQARLKLLRQRLDNLALGEQKLKQVDSDLARIEAQVDLALENASLRGGGAAVAANLELAGQALDEEFDFGDAETAVLALDQAYAVPPRSRERS